MADRLADRVAVVTGAGSGIGRAVAVRFAAEGATVVVNDLNPQSADATAELIRSAGGAAYVAPGDVTDSAFVNGLVAAAVSRHGRLDVMHNNAGAQFVNALLSELSDEDWMRTLALNLNSVFFGIRAAIRVMEPAGRGSIISTASLAGLGASARTGAYGTAKAGVVQLTKVAAVEFAHTGVRINAIAPGTMHTPALDVWMASQGLDMEPWARQIPQARLGTPEDIAGAAMFLATDDSSYLNGVTIAIDGGRMAKLGGPHAG